MTRDWRIYARVPDRYSLLSQTSSHAIYRVGSLFPLTGSERGYECHSSGVFKSIILALASDEALSSSTPVRIEPYEGRNGYTKVVVYSEGVKLDWVTKQLPEQEVVLVGGKQVRDDSKQMELITSLCATIIERIAGNNKKA